MKVYIRKRAGRTRWEMFYRDPATGKRITRTTGELAKKDATKAAGAWEANLKAGHIPTHSTCWDVFRNRFEDEYLPSRARQTRSVYMTALTSFESVIGHVTALSLITPSTISRFQKALRDGGLSENTIVTYLKHIRAALRWAADLHMIPKAPTIRMPRVTGRPSKGRPLTEAEFRTLLRSVTKIPDIDHNSFCWFLRGLWFSGFRIGELLRLSFDSPPVQLDMDGGRFPKVHWSATGHKSRLNQVVAIPPDFAKLIREQPANTGRVFIPRTMRGPVVSADHASRLVAEIGRASGIKVSATKHASAHDIRRSFATRWASKVKPVTLMNLMRHESIETTLQYYVDIDADDAGEELWR